MPSNVSDFQIKVSNYLVPATGGTAAVSVKYAGDGTAELPINIVWKNYSLDGEPFNPSGFYAANFSLETVYIKISGNDLIYTVPPGVQCGRMYPAPFDHNVQIYGLGTAEIVFCNSPVIPYYVDPSGGSGGGGAVTIADGADVAQGATTDIPTTDPSAAATVVTLLKTLAAAQLGTDTDGIFLPFNLTSLPWSATYTAGIMQTETYTESGSGVTWTKTYTYTGADLTGVSGWVRSAP